MSDDDNALIAKAGRGARYLVALQLLSRALTFVLNVFIVRMVSGEVLGVAAVQLQLLLSTVLFLSREGFRRTCIRANENKSKTKNKAIAKDEQSASENEHDEHEHDTLIWWIVPWGAFVCSLGFVFFVATGSAEEMLVPRYCLSMACVAFAAWLELCAEPLFVVAQNAMEFGSRVAIEGIAVFARCVATYALVLLVGDGNHLLAFGCAQLLYAGVCVLGWLYRSRSWAMSRAGWARRWRFSGLWRVERSRLGLLGSFMWQSAQKLLLQEGENYVLRFSVQLVDQGVYSVVSNLGSLVVRFLFLPIEEAAYALFARLVGGDARRRRRSARASAARVLAALLRLMVLVGLIFAAFGANYAWTLVDVLYGAKLSSGSAPSTLAAYCAYVPIMAINGITEAFVHAVATPRELTRFNYLLLLVSAVYVGTALVAVRHFHTVGLVLANVVSQSLRIAGSLFYIVRFFRAADDATGNNSAPLFRIGDALPSPTLIAAAASIALVTRQLALLDGATPSASMLDAIATSAPHLGVGIATFSAFAALCYALERSLFVELKSLFFC
jgi:oligosaccharide translocation protein RFT1